MKIVDDGIVMSSGRTFYAFGGILGINEDLEVHYGYDGILALNYLSGESEATPEDKRELADHMIALWTKYRDSA